MALTKVSNSMLVQPVNNNILINPSFTVKQRGDVIDHNGTSYGPDRWRVRGLADVGGTMSQSTTDSTTGINKLVVKHRNATSYANITQYIETLNLLGLYGKEMTFSFSYSDTGGSGIPNAQAGTFDSSGTYKPLFNAVPKSLGNNRWSCTFTLSTDDGTFRDLNETGMQVAIYPNEKNTAPSEWFVWETKLEVGSVATPFIARSYGEELALCHRYYYDTNDTSTAYAHPITTNATTFRSLTIYLPQIMRVAPSLDYTVGGQVTPAPTDIISSIDSVYFQWNGIATGDFVGVKSLITDAEL